jgi:para-nitrobenzyl esterase
MFTATALRLTMMVPALLLSSGAALAQSPSSAPTAHVSQGDLVGGRDGAVQAFLGVPYAAPPVGVYRWKAPQPAVKWRGPRQAAEFGASCVQQVFAGGRPPWTHEYMVSGKVSEDCLTLNVWTTAHAGEKRPVLVWIHGGGFQEGSGSVPIYQGASLAGRDIVVVSINYRLGLFGFLSHPDLTREAGAGVASNFGLADQIAALKWVQANIAAFGGDPAQVTIAGQSAGSMAVHTLVVSPLAMGLFKRAIAESGLPNVLPMQTLAQSEQNGLAYARDKRASSIAQLRAMSPEQLAVAPGTGMGGKFQFGPIIDGKLLPAAPLEMVARGMFNDVPMMIGQNADEGSAFPGYGAGDEAAYNAFMARSFGKKVDVFGQFYAGTSDADRSLAVKTASRDRGLASIDQWANPRLEKGKTPVWGYYFSHAEPGEKSTQFGAFHSSEIPYALSNLDVAPERNFTPVDRALAQTMSGYWVNFVKKGDPNGPGLLPWASLDRTYPSVIEFGDSVRVRPLLTEDKLKAYRDYARDGGVFGMF